MATKFFSPRPVELKPAFFNSKIQKILQGGTRSFLRQNQVIISGTLGIGVTDQPYPHGRIILHQPVYFLQLRFPISSKQEIIKVKIYRV